MGSIKNTRVSFNNIVYRCRQSSAFNAIWRDKLIEITEESLEEDKMRMLRVLLTDTNLEIKIQGADRKPFQSNIGSPQGDAVSGHLF